jgi:DNA-binding XRE family transcriptional regulator
MNRVEKYRAQAKLSQRALAALVGVSQQTIQRIEAESVSVRFETAIAVAQALGVSPKALFPDIRPSALTTDAVRREERIDYSHCSHTLMMAFTGGLRRDYLVDEATASRVRDALMDTSARFLAFDTDQTTVVVNTAELLWTNVLFDPGEIVSAPEAPAFPVEVALYFRGEDEPSKFNVEPDTGSLSNEDEDGVELQSMLWELELIDPGENNVLRFTDEDGEEVLINTRSLIILEVPLHGANPKLLEKVMEGLEEDEDAAF